MPLYYVDDEGNLECNGCTRCFPVEEFKNGGERYCRQCRQARRYGVSSFDFLKLLQDQQGRCAICGIEPTGKGNDVLCIDHVHGHDEWDIPIRGALCHACNQGLGAFRDDADVLIRAAEYLRGKPVLMGETAKHKRHIRVQDRIWQEQMKLRRADERAAQEA